MFPAEIFVTPVYDEKGALLTEVSVIRDITERKRLEQERLALEEKYFKAFNSSVGLLLISTLDTGVLLEVNREFELLTGYSREEVLGKTTPELKLWWNQSDRTQFADALRQKSSVQNLEVRFRSKAGECIHGLVAAEIIHLKEGPCILFSLRDITERKKTEKVLQNKEKTLQRQARDLEEINIALDGAP